MSSVLLLLLAVAFNVGANLLFRHASAIPGYPAQKMVLLGVGLFIGLVNTLLYIKALEQMPLGTAFPVYSAASIVVIAAAAALLFGEAWSTQRVIGVVTICVGIVVLGRA
jgi:multidrug transporter EmrE-like cation transporter